MAGLPVSALASHAAERQQERIVLSVSERLRVAFLGLVRERRRCAVSRNKEGTVVAIRDTGLGIPNDMLHEVVVMFTQVNRTLDRAQGGLGIGLALVKRMVEMHGGSVRAESAGAGCGSTFTVRLPLTAVSGANDQRGSRIAAADIAAIVPRRVLIVDDNADVADSFAMMLRLFGHEVRVSYDGPSALETARHYRPELVFLDIGLPKMNGYEVAKHFARDPLFRRPVLVALTGWGAEHDKQRAADAGFDVHLTKPVDAAAVHGVLARFHAPVADAAKP